MQDLAKFLRETGRPFTEANNRAVAVMLSMTPGELALALTLVQGAADAQA